MYYKLCKNVFSFITYLFRIHCCSPKLNLTNAPLWNSLFTFLLLVPFVLSGLYFFTSLISETVESDIMGIIQHGCTVLESERSRQESHWLPTTGPQLCPPSHEGKLFPTPNLPGIFYWITIITKIKYFVLFHGEPGCAPYQFGQHLPKCSSMGGRAYGSPYGSRNCPTFCCKPLYPRQHLYSNGNGYNDILFYCLLINVFIYSDVVAVVVFLTLGGVWESHALVRVYFEAAAGVRPR